MTKDVEIAVIGQHFETLIAGAVPLIQDLFDFERSSAGLVLERKPQRPLIGLVAGITFDLEVNAHAASTSLPETHCPEAWVGSDCKFRTDGLSVGVEF